MDAQQQKPAVDPAKRWKSARTDLIIVLIFTVVNLIFLLLEQDTYFLFSVSVPYYLTAFGMGLDIGMRLGSEFTVIALVISAVILGGYLLLWWLSKKRPVCLLLAAIAFIVDTLVLIGVAFLLLDEPMSVIVDLVFHGFVSYALFSGYFAAKKLPPVQAVEAPVTSPEF